VTDETDILTERRGAVTIVTLNRPEKMNALTTAMTESLAAVLIDADADDEVGAVVLTGSGRAFCAGADTSALGGMGGESLRDSYDRIPRDAAMRMRTPIIAAVNGAAIGAGLSLALMADVRFGSTAASISTAFARLGLVAEQGSSYLLHEIVGRANALDLLLSSRKVDADSAYRMGFFQFLNAPEELLDAAVAYAEGVAANSAYSVAQIKEQLDQDTTRSFDVSFRDSVQRMHTSLERDEFQERVRALSKRSTS
jgi:enoyl-CoA hydratase/carnithine racemase